MIDNNVFENELLYFTICYQSHQSAEFSVMMQENFSTEFFKSDALLTHASCEDMSNHNVNFFLWCLFDLSAQLFFLFFTFTWNKIHCDEQYFYEINCAHFWFSFILFIFLQSYFLLLHFILILILMFLFHMSFFHFELSQMSFSNHEWSL